MLRGMKRERERKNKERKAKSFPYLVNLRKLVKSIKLLIL